MSFLSFNGPGNHNHFKCFCQSNKAWKSLRPSKSWYHSKSKFRKA
uniref:Uncharacterized protein n=1 Tax=Arundo donax TaxID=35708 RepID=A0A0A9E9G9_ARUDO